MFYKEELFPRITERYLDKHGHSFPMSSKSVVKYFPFLILNKKLFTGRMSREEGGGHSSKVGGVRRLAG